MASKKSNGGRKAIAPSVISALTIAPAIIKAIEELMDKFPDMPTKVAVPQLYDSNLRLKLDDAVMALTSAGLKPIPSELKLEDADPKYKNCFDSQVIWSSLKHKQKTQVGTTVIVKYVTQEVIAASQKMFEEQERQKAEDKRLKTEKRAQQIEQAQKIFSDAASSAKDGVRKILPHRKGKDYQDTESNK